MSGELDIAAAEYVLGTLDREERDAFAERLKTDARARAAVASWDARFAALADPIQPIKPPPNVWADIERALKKAAASPMSLRVIEGGGAPADATIALRRALRRWRITATVSSGLAAALLVFVGLRAMGGGLGTGSGFGPADSSVYVAAVNRGGDKPALLVRVDIKTGRILVRPVAAEAPEGKSLQLWYISDGKPPRSMGLVTGKPAALDLPAGTDAKAATFAISVEPPGGSTTGTASGPVVYAGQLVKE